RPRPDPLPALFSGIKPPREDGAAAWRIADRTNPRGQSTMRGRERPTPAHACYAEMRTLSLRISMYVPEYRSSSFNLAVNRRAAFSIFLVGNQIDASMSWHASLCPVLRCMTSLGRSVTARPVVPGPYQGSVAFVLTGVGFVVWITQSAGGERIDECQEIGAERGGGDGGTGGLRWPASKRGAGRDGYHGALFRAGRRRGRAGRRH